MSEANVPPRHDYDSSSDVRSRDQWASASAQDWEAVPLPGTMAQPMPAAAPDEAATQPSRGSREGELLALIRDLNRCNEVLLARINHLEATVETSQHTLQAEVERSQATPHATAANSSVAQLLSELEQTGDALKRQTILSETLKAQLETSQERVAHLEQECAVLQKRCQEKTQALHRAEDDCRDLRSRLQRQQRYTLQFKAALEKCLDMSAAQKTREDSPIAASAGLDAPLPTAGAELGANPLAMPRADRIQPWSAVATPTAQPDPHLLSLLRSTPDATPPAPEPRAADLQAAAPEADEHFWQDIERVIERSTPEPAAPEPAPVADVPGFTEPMPWGPSVRSQPEPEPDLVPQVAESEPPVVPTPQPSVEPAKDLPIFQSLGATGASPSPIVHPLRPPKKKRTSLSAVELPSFPPLSTAARAKSN
ncbi:MAG: hypothetical protein IGR92_07175 [Leptolyngbyaceae cyanobacterium T60_A2020_046]|nr:hypothetical protein [Leptolyngbyaceae cyanobacterium T60_A2020_046]